MAAGREPTHKWRLTPHAHERARDMGVSRDQILEVLREPDYDVPSAAQWYGPHRRIATREKIEIVYREDTKLIITILWTRAKKEWYRAS